jgi:hypothetical protein
MVQHLFSQEKPVGDLELVMAFEGPMPTGASSSTFRGGMIPKRVPPLVFKRLHFAEQ